MSDINYKNSVLICGQSKAGKSWSLKEFAKDPAIAKNLLYMNCEAGKDLPFKNTFIRKTVDNPYEVFGLYKKIIDMEAENKCPIKVAVIDTASFLMSRYESFHIVNAANKMDMWSKYAEYFRSLMHDHIGKAQATTIVLGHLDRQIDPNTEEVSYSVPVKGNLAKSGLEAFFTTVIYAMKVSTKDLAKYDTKENKLLNITDEEFEIGYKHVFQTRVTKDTIGARISAPDGLFNYSETYIDNDAHALVKRLSDYYKS